MIRAGTISEVGRRVLQDMLDRRSVDDRVTGQYPWFHRWTIGMRPPTATILIQSGFLAERPSEDPRHPTEFEYQITENGRQAIE